MTYIPIPCPYWCKQTSACPSCCGVNTSRLDSECTLIIDAVKTVSFEGTKIIIHFRHEDVSVTYDCFLPCFFFSIYLFPLFSGRSRFFASQALFCHCYVSSNVEETLQLLTLLFYISVGTAHDDKIRGLIDIKASPQRHRCFQTSSAVTPLTRTEPPPTPVYM